MRYIDNSIPEPNSGCYLWLGGWSQLGYGGGPSRERSSGRWRPPEHGEAVDPRAPEEREMAKRLRRSDWDREMEQAGICQCGHDFTMHVELPGYPGGCQECQADDCDCGQIRPR